MTTKQSMGKVAIVPRGYYDKNVQYYTLDLVRYKSDAYIAKCNVKGVSPSNETYWMMVAAGASGGGGATLDSNGILSWG